MNDIERYIRESLELDLFFLRIMKEHALFMQLGFTPKNLALANEANGFLKRFDALLQRTIDLAKGTVSRSVLASGELFTRYTEEAERQTQFFTGVPIDRQLTVEEYDLGGDGAFPTNAKAEVDKLNAEAAELTRALIRLQERVHGDVLMCRIFTLNYPLYYEHITHEAEHYLAALSRLTAGDLAESPLAQEELFWNDIMHEHAEFIDGQLDPSETALKQAAAAFARRYARLEELTRQEIAQSGAELTAQTESTTASFRNFKAQGAEGILSCKVRSVIIPLLADHVLREANRYLRILRENMAK